MSVRLVKHPVLCNYYLTYRCNAKCSFCDIWERPSPYADLDRFRANLRDLKRLGVRIVDFTGGEPLLHRGLPEMLQLAKAQGFLTTVTTNGLLYPKYAEKIRGNVDMLHFSLDFPDRDRHNASRGVDCYDHVMKSIAVAKKLGERPDILYTVTDASLAGISEVYHRIAQPNGLLLLLNPVFDYNAVGGQLDAAAYPHLHAWGRMPGVYLNDAFLDVRKAGGNQVATPVCKAASTTVVISPDNALVLPCYHLGEAELPIQDNLYALWHRPATQALIAQEGRLPGCQGCTVNCYLQPSFAVETNRYFWRALPSTLKYNLEKWVYAPKQAGVKAAG